MIRLDGHILDLYPGYEWRPRVPSPASESVAIELMVEQMDRCGGYYPDPAETFADDARLHSGAEVLYVSPMAPDDGLDEDGRPRIY